MSVRSIRARTRSFLKAILHRLCRDRDQLDDWLRLLVDNVDQVFWVISPDETELYYVNPAYQALTGRSCESLYADTMSWIEVLHPDDARHVTTGLAARASGPGKDLRDNEYRIIQPDGSMGWVWMRSRPIFDQAGQIVARVGALIDISKRKWAEQTLRQRNRELALLNRASEALSATLDLDLVLATILEEMRRLLGVVAGSVWLIDPDTDELVCRHATGLHNNVVHGWRLSPGEGVVGWAAFHGEKLVIPDTRIDERYFKGVDQQTGLELRSVISVPLRIKSDVIGVLQVVDSAVNRFSSTDVTLLESLAASAAIAVDNARLVKELRQHTSDLEARNEELDAFAHTVAHDLKSPLAHMVGFAHALAEDYTALPDQELRRCLCTIAESGHKMSNIIDALLLLASVHKAEQVEMTHLDMNQILIDVQKRLTFMIEEYRAEIVLPERWPVALGYGPWVEEVWTNYISNAIKHGGRPPRIELGGTVQPDDDALAAVRFWVRDNGPGLTHEEQARLFKPFERLGEQRVKGHGLGLSIVLRIVEKLGGQVGVESQSGQGCEFGFTLPAAQ